MEEKIYIRCSREPFIGDRVAILITKRDGDGMFRANTVWTPINTPGVSTEPTIRFEAEEAQSLMDELWRAGLRPTEGRGSAGSLAATERHLEDMRALVFKSGKP